MLKMISIVTLLGASLSASANLVSLNYQELTETTGQGGADLSWTLSLNHQYATDMSKLNISNGNPSNPNDVFYKLDPDSCGTNNLLCRLAIAPNNHVDENGNKKWLVFKQLQGTIQIDKFSLDGTTIINHHNEPQTAMKISFYDDKPLKIRNLGFATLAIETGTGEGANEGYANSQTYNKFTGRVYQADGTFTEEEQDVPLFDRGTEKGFMGLNVHGNMHMNGNLKIFSYNCTGGIQSRC